MTFEKGVERLVTRLQVDLESEVDTTDNEKMAYELILGAKQVSRDAYLFWKPQASLVLTHADALATAPEYSTLNPNICTEPIFECRGVYINGQWLTFYSLPDFEQAIPEYFNTTASSNPSIWTFVESERIRISDPANSTARAATNYIRGFAEYPTWTYNLYSQTEMLGPSTMHLAYVNKAALNLSLSNTATDEGRQRRIDYEREYSLLIYGGKDRNGQWVKGIQSTNLERVRPLTSKQGMGQQRRRFGVGNLR